MVATIEKVAHEQAVRQDLPGVVLYLNEVLGSRLTAVVAGVSDAKAVKEWAKGERTPHPDTAQRLREAYRVVLLLMHTESAETVRAWFRGMNPELEDRAPAIVLAEDPVRVLQAARSFLAHG